MSQRIVQTRKPREMTHPPTSPHGNDIQTPSSPKMRGSIISGMNMQSTWRQKERASEAKPYPSPWSAELVTIVTPMNGSPIYPTRIPGTPIASSASSFVKSRIIGPAKISARVKLIT